MCDPVKSTPVEALRSIEPARAQSNVSTSNMTLR